MNRSGAILLSLAVLAFVASGLAFALMTTGAMPAVPSYMDSAAFRLTLLTSLAVPGLGMTPTAASSEIDLASLFLDPDGPALWLLLAAVWAALIGHAARVLWIQWQTERAAGHGPWATTAPEVLAVARQHRDDNAPSEHAALSLALLIGAIWPWMAVENPLAGFLLATAMFTMTLTAALRGQREGAHIRQYHSIGFFAGWATAATFAAFATLLNSRLGVPPAVAISMAILMCAGTGIFVQLKMGGTFSYSIAVIWSLLGLTAATVANDPTIATVAILGIAAMAIVLVRAAS